MSLDRDQIDRALADWQTRVTRVKANLQVLEDSPTYTLAQRGLLSFAGRSRVEVGEPLRSAADLADFCTILEAQVARAASLRASLRPVLPSEATLREIEDLLTGASVPISAPQVPLAQRTLLADTGQTRITLQQLVDRMTTAFVAARDAVTRYDAAIQALKPALDDAETRQHQLEARAAALGVAAQTRFGALGDAIRQVRERALDDPLGAADTFGRQVADVLEPMEQQVAALEREREQALVELARARDRQRRAERHFAPEQTRDLGEWLESIARTLGSGQFGAARVGLERWSADATGVYGTREQRDEQLDVLRALRAKAQSLRSRGLAVAPEADALALQAEDLLRQQPPAVDAARTLIGEYQRALASIR